jgi:hypothetical protein
MMSLNSKTPQLFGGPGPTCQLHQTHRTASSSSFASWLNGTGMELHHSCMKLQSIILTIYPDKNSFSVKTVADHSTNASVRNVML